MTLEFFVVTDCIEPKVGIIDVDFNLLKCFIIFFVSDSLQTNELRRLLEAKCRSLNVPEIVQKVKFASVHTLIVLRRDS